MEDCNKYVCALNEKRMQFDRKTAIENSELHTQEIQILELFDKNDKLTIFDIGACEGESSIRYSRIFPNSKIYTFEPNPSNFKLVEKNIENFSSREQITPFQLCLTDKTGTAEFYISSGTPEEFKEKEVDWDFGNKSSSLLPPDKTLEAFDWLKFNDVVQVKTERLDNLMKENNIDQIDFIHMDVQGAELMVLNGSGEKISRINNIWLEVEGIPLYKGQPIRKDVEKYMRNIGYVKILDSFDKVAGDQFWSKKEWLLTKKSENWIKEREQKLKEEEKARQKPLIESIRDKVQLRSRIRSILGGKK